MKQILQRQGRVSVEEVPTPAVLPGFVLVRTVASLVSAGTERAAAEAGQKSLVQKAMERPRLVGQVLERVAADGLATTIEAVRNRLNEPLQLGYSAAGIVIRAGTEASMFNTGDLVACAGAGYANHAEVLCVPRNLCVPVPPGVPAEDAAFGTVGAIALHGVRLARLDVGSTVAIIGLGLLGQLAAQIASAAGCRVVGIDLQPDRVDLARRLGADAATTPENAGDMTASMTGGVGVDAVLICADTSGNQPIELAGVLARDRATVVAVGSVGMSVPRSTFYAKELTLLVSRSYGPGRYDAEYEIEGHDYPVGYVRWTENRNLAAFLDLVGRGRVRVGPLITHRFPIDSAAAAYEVINGLNKEPSLGVLLTYPGHPELTQSIDRQPLAAAAPRAKGEQPRIGVLGSGTFAKAVLLPALKSAGARMAGVIGRQGVNAKVCADRFGFDYFGTDESRIFADQNVDVVVVATRHDRHASQVLAAAAAGKDVFVEKPLCLTPLELEDIRRTFSVPGAPRLMVGFNRRFAPLAVQFKEFVRESGQPLMVNYRVNAGTVPPDHWVHDPKEGGGRIIGEACHFVDFIGWLVDADPVTVTAQSLGNDPADDGVLIIMTYAGGSVGTISYVSTGDPAQGKERIEAHGGGRSAVLDDFRQLELCSNNRCRTVRHRFGQDKGHRDECAAFIRAIARGEPSPIPLEQILTTTRVMFLVLESARSRASVAVHE
ncbi:MAG TPA: bi-domain-containing oxidoreductase [Vicinamibacterales bacterium]|nr:bi-domain-containing oxidoreductase [Vicinamibacterales bacterium]